MNGMNRVLQGVVWAGVALSAAALDAGRSNSLLDISADGTLLASANRDNGSVSIVDLASGKVLHEVPVGHKPEGVAFLGAGHELVAAVYGDDLVAVIDGDKGSVIRRVPVFDC